jgi:hypothetical protein
MKQHKLYIATIRQYFIHNLHAKLENSVVQSVSHRLYINTYFQLLTFNDFNFHTEI